MQTTLWYTPETQRSSWNTQKHTKKKAGQFCNKVLCTAETKINLYQNDGKSGRGKKKEATHDPVHHPISQTWWFCGLGHVWLPNWHIGIYRRCHCWRKHQDKSRAIEELCVGSDSSKIITKAKTLIIVRKDQLKWCEDRKPYRLVCSLWHWKS